MIRRRAGDVYAFWRDMHNLEQCMPDGIAVSTPSKQVSHFNVRAPGGHRVEWDADIVKDERGRVIAWRSREGGDLANSGAVRFEPSGTGGESTKVVLEIEYQLPGGVIGKAIGKAAQASAAREIAAGLRRVKARLESVAPDEEHVPAGG